MNEQKKNPLWDVVKDAFYNTPTQGNVFDAMARAVKDAGYSRQPPPVVTGELSNEYKRQFFAAAETIYMEHNGDERESRAAAFDYLIREIPARLSPVEIEAKQECFITSEHPPTNADLDEHGRLLGFSFEATKSWVFCHLNEFYGRKYTYWMKCPALPPPVVSAEEEALNAFLKTEKGYENFGLSIEAREKARSAFLAGITFAATQQNKEE